MLVRHHPARAQALDELGSGFAALYECAPLAIATLTPQGRFLQSNGALQRYLGYNEKELAARTFNDVTYPADIPACVELFDKLRRREIDNFEMEKRYVRKDGEMVWAHVVVVAVRARGALHHTIGVAVDITPRKRAEEKVRRLTVDLEERVRERTAELGFDAALLTAEQEASPDGILVMDGQNRIIGHNLRFRELWGLPIGSPGMSGIDDFMRWALPRLAAPEEYLDRVKYLDEHREDNSRYEIDLLDGRVLETYSGPIIGSANAYYGRVWYFRDISSRRQAENALREKTAELSRSNVELEVYAHAASHDLVAPLNKISMYSELLMERSSLKLDDKERGFLERIQKTAVGMTKLLRDILAMSKVGHESDPVETVNWERVMNAVLSDLELPITRSGAVVVVGAMPGIRAQEILFRQLLSNLIGNAVKFHHQDRAPRVEVGGRMTGSGIEVFVRDDGIGFSQEHAQEIFKPFVRLNPMRDYEGNGIGLATCQRIAMHLGGRLTAEGVPEKGAAFTLWLPATMRVETPEVPP